MFGRRSWRDAAAWPAKAGGGAFLSSNATVFTLGWTSLEGY